MIILNTIISGQIPVLTNLAIRIEGPERLALANSLVTKKITRLTVAAIPRAAVSPIAAMLVMVVTVVVVTVLITLLSFLSLYRSNTRINYKSTFVNTYTSIK